MVEPMNAEMAMDWHDSRPEEQGMDSERLAQAFYYLTRNFPALHRLLVIRHGYVVFNRQNPASREAIPSKLFRGVAARLSRNAPQGTFQDNTASGWNIRSAAKSVLSILVGIAVQEKYLDGLNQTVGDLLPDYAASLEPDKKKITLRHLLTMTSGLRSVEHGLAAIRMLASPDWTQFMLRLPLDAQPGERFIYNSANPHLCSAILSRATGMSAFEFAQQRLFHPLGIDAAAWESAPEGVTFGGGNLFLTPEAMAKIGCLYLHDGEWEGRQIVAREWVAESLEKHQVLFPGWDYGYYWYLHDETDAARGKTFRGFSAAGAGGQKILVLPDLDIVWVATAKTDMIGEKGIHLNFITSKFLLPAVKDYA